MQESLSNDKSLPGALEGIRVIDAATLFAGPVIATLLGDHGADVVKVEHPKGDTLRKLGWQKEGVSLWWEFVSRNKRSLTAKLSDERGAEILKRLARDSDVLIENFRPGTLERWGIGPSVLHEINPRLVIVRVTGFGQTGPYRTRPGYGTLAESMSGFAHMNGHPGGPPTLPPFALADGVTALTGAFAVMMALWNRDHPSGTSNGRIIDLSIYEPLFWILGPHASAYDQLGIVQGRTGNRAPFTAPRNAFQAKDGTWLGLSGSSQSVAERVMHVVGRPDMVHKRWFDDHEGRLEHVDEIDEAISGWIANRTADEVVQAFEEASAAITPIMSIADIFEDPQYEARETIVTVDHPRLGPMKMQGFIPRMESCRADVRQFAPELGENSGELLSQLRFTTDEIQQFEADGVTFTDQSHVSEVGGARSDS